MVLFLLRPPTLEEHHVDLRSDDLHGNDSLWGMILVMQCSCLLWQLATCRSARMEQ